MAAEKREQQRKDDRGIDFSAYLGPSVKAFNLEASEPEWETAEEKRFIKALDEEVLSHFAQGGGVRISKQNSGIPVRYKHPPGPWILSFVVPGTHNLYPQLEMRWGKVGENEQEVEVKKKALEAKFAQVVKFRFNRFILQNPGITWGAEFCGGGRGEWIIDVWFKSSQPFEYSDPKAEGWCFYD